ncbi:hypothetical protein [uncultured Shewanella sp.]|uniref:hypothetical protein n=1 Tax=uncultured Shewanella sp. TaxID=173975 RepID=UPI0026112FCC|nr:hypothetical protein [uncultured Shewanella sp.]
MLYFKHKIMLVAVSLCVLITYLLFSMFVPLGQTERDATASVNKPSTVEANQNALISFDTVASNWHWQKEAVNTEQVLLTQQYAAKYPFTPQSVFDALYAVKLDANGNVILDHDALVSLDETLERIHNRLDEESVAVLVDLIYRSLPGQAGMQLGELVENYYYYLESKAVFSRINEDLLVEREMDPLMSIEQDQGLYAELQALREAHLGSDVTAELFRVSDANAQYMFESMKLEADLNLTSQEREQKRKDIQAQHIAQSVNVLNWPARYPVFLSAKQAITSSAIDNQEKVKQVNALLSQHFTPEELTRIDYLKLNEI